VAQPKCPCPHTHARTHTHTHTHTHRAVAQTPKLECPCPTFSSVCSTVIRCSKYQMPVFEKTQLQTVHWTGKHIAIHPAIHTQHTLQNTRGTHCKTLVTHTAKHSQHTLQNTRNTHCKTLATHTLATHTRNGSSEWKIGIRVGKVYVC